MYGASVRDISCSGEFIDYVNKQGKPHCYVPFDVPDGNNINIISFDPGLNETLSPVSSAP